MRTQKIDISQKNGHFLRKEHRQPLRLAIFVVPLHRQKETDTSIGLRITESKVLVKVKDLLEGIS